MSGHDKSMPVWHTMTSRPKGHLSSAQFKKTRARQLEWPGDCRHTRVSQLRRRERFCRRAPNALQICFTYTAHAARHRPHTPALTCLPRTSMHPHKMDDRGAVQSACGQATTGVSTHRQEHGTRQLHGPLGSSRSASLIPGPKGHTEGVLL
jgi:hypothetical protein